MISHKWLFLRRIESLWFDCFGFIKNFVYVTLYDVANISNIYIYINLWTLSLSFSVLGLILVIYIYIYIKKHLFYILYLVEYEIGVSFYFH